MMLSRETLETFLKEIIFTLSIWNGSRDQTHIEVLTTLHFVFDKNSIINETMFVFCIPPCSLNQ